MKTILKYAIPLVILAGIFLAGRFTASDNTDELQENWKQERKLLMEGIVKKQAEVTDLTHKGEAQDKKIASLETAVKKGDEKIKAIQASNQKKVEVVARYTPVQRDSFFYAKYPGQDTIRNVDSRMVAIDLVRLEGLDSLTMALRQQNDTLKAEVAEQKERIATSEQKFEKQKEITADFVRRGDSYRNESEHYQKKDRKHRRQRNGLAAGLVVVIVISLFN